MQIRDRIRELRRVHARELVPNSKNWRTHPERQQNALRGILAEIGYADALLAREMEDGRLQLIDGHLRAETTPDQEVPVLILDLDDREADLLLTLLDPLAALAETKQDLLSDLVSRIETENEVLKELMAEMTGTALENLPFGDETLKDLAIPELFQIVVQCKNEDEQREVFEQLVAEGRKCKIMNL